MDGRERYINPFTDFGFKKLFGTEFNKELLVDFLNQVLGGREQVRDLTYLNTESLGRTASDRNAIFDLYCENEKGEKFIIELQNVRQKYFKDRSIFYSTFPIQDQAPKGGNWDYYLKAVYTIGILNFSFPSQEGKERYLREVQLMDKQTHEIFYDKLTFIYVEVANFTKDEQQLETHFDKWMYVLKNLSRLRDRPHELQGKIFERLFIEAEIAKLKPKDMKAYQESLKAYWDNYSVQKTVEMAAKEAREAREKGKEEGIKEGKIEIAREMKKEKLPTSQIIRITGLTKEQIEKL